MTFIFLTESLVMRLYDLLINVVEDIYLRSKIVTEIKKGKLQQICSSVVANPGLTVSELDSGSSVLEWPSPKPSGQGHCVVFLGKPLNCCHISLHPGVQMGTSELNSGLGITL